MRILWLLFAGLLVASCGGKLSDEQREKMREKMDEEEIRKISSAQLTEASFAYGRSIVTLVESRKNALSNAVFIDSLEKVFRVSIISMSPGDSMLAAVESQIIEAYITGAGELELTDNIQQLGKDTTLYTKPIVEEQADGSVTFTRAVGIYMPNKSVILSIKD